ncbi:hypothetical protein ABKV19_021512 [Rosa sericea]
MVSEITEEKDDESSYFVDPEVQKERIRRIIEYQKSLYQSSSSSSSSSSSAASCSSFSSSQKRSSSLSLVQGGNTSSQISEIIEEKNDEDSCCVDPEAQRERIRRIIEHQKSLWQSSSSSSSLSSSAASCSSFSSSRRSGSLLSLMKVGNTSLKRLFEMEHTSLANHFDDLSGSPVIKPILLWGSDTDNEHEIYNPWPSIMQFGPRNDSRIDRQSKFASDGSVIESDGFHNREVRTGKRKLTRKKSFRRLPGFGIWRCGGYRMRLRLRRLRIAFCRRKY